MTFRNASIPVALGLMLACGDADRAPVERADAPSDSAPAHHFTTGSSSYTLRRDGAGWISWIDFAYRNDGGTLYVVNCNGAITMFLQKHVAGRWQDALYMASNGCLSPPIVIPPGETLRDSVAMWGAEPGTPSVNTFLLPGLDGEYRLVWHQLVRNYDPRPLSAFGDTLAVEERVSTPFVLRRAGT